MVLVHIGAAYPSSPTAAGSRSDGEDALRQELRAAVRESIGEALATAKDEAAQRLAAEREAREQKQRADAAESRAHALEVEVAVARERLDAAEREASKQREFSAAAEERARAAEEDAAAMRERLAAAEREAAARAVVLRAEDVERVAAAAGGLLVRPDESIMEAVERAGPGQTIFLASGRLYFSEP